MPPIFDHAWDVRVGPTLALRVSNAAVAAKEESLTMSRVSTRTFSLALVSLLAAACSASSSGGAATDNSVSAADDSEAISSSSQSSYADEILFGPIQSNDPMTAASSVASSQWWPAGCVTRKVDPTNATVVDVTLNDCTGPFGLLHFTGDITLTFSPGASGGVHVEGTGANMTINGHAATFARSADITVDSTSHTVTVDGSGSWTRVDLLGDTVSHTRMETTVIDPVMGCRTSNGSAVTTVGQREIDSKFMDYKICKTADGDGCPSGTITHVRKASGDTVTVTFDGSNQAEITGPRGSAEVMLVCGG
jgi:hypothetical protein